VAQEQLTPRLVIGQIKLVNFKSYGGERVIGPFHSQFSSIVGPNGSGKSNVIDAMLFVFGKKASKIRLKKVSELIHNSKDHENLESAKVTVDFWEVVDLPDGSVQKVQGSDFSVGREAFRNNQSKYYLNSKTSNMTEVTQKLITKGIDLEHNRFLILQGEVEQIALMKPKAQSEHEDGLLEYLEDLIGSNSFAQPIEVATKELETVSDKRQEKMNRMRAAEKDKDALEGPRKEAEEYVRAEAMHLEQRSRLAQIERFNALKDADVAKEEMKAAQGRLEEVRSRIGEEGKELRNLQKELDSHDAKLGNVREEMNKAREEFTKFEKEDLQLNEDTKYQQQKMQKLEAQKKQEEDKAQRLIESAQQLDANIPAAEQALADAQNQVKKFEETLEGMMKEIRGTTDKLGKDKTAEEKKLTEIKKKQNVAQQAAEIAVAEVKAITQRKDALTNQRTEIEHGITAADEKLKARTHEKKQMEKERNKACEEHEQAAQDVKVYGDAKKELGEQLKMARGAFEEARNTLQSQAGKSALVKAVMAAVKSGKLHGVHGRLGDLGTIASKYDVSISTACGALDNLVVDTTEDAQAAVEFLRENNLGRATFIVLDKVQGRKLSEDRPENLPRLLDLVKLQSPAYKIAFQYALGDTLVSDNLDQATRVGLQGAKRRRVVTLDGKLIDSSGTMSGGGATQNKGGMKSSASDVTEADVMKLGQKCEEIAKAYEEAKAGLAKAEETMASAEKRAKDAEMRCRQIEMELTAVKDSKKVLTERLAQCPVAEFTAAEKDELKGAQKKVDKAMQELEAIAGGAKVHEDKIAELHQEIINAGGWQLKKKKEDVEKGKQQVEQIQKALAKNRVDAESARKNAEKVKMLAKKAMEEFDAAEKSILALKKKRDELDEKATAVLAEFQRTRDVLAAHETENQGVRDRVAELEGKLKEVKKAELEVQADLEKREKALKDAEKMVIERGKYLSAARKEFKGLQIDLLSEELEWDDGICALKEEVPVEVLVTLHPKDIEAKMLTLEGNIKQMKPNLTVITDYRAKVEAWKEKQADFEKVNAERDEKRREVDLLRQQRLDAFMAGFQIISLKLKEMYQMITLGGDAELELVDTLDPFSEGIHFSVRPPKKSWKQIQNLSGGEKTLSSLALVFALHHYKPTPLYFMDEIDAALDFRNVSIIANYIKDRTKNAQFIIISLRNHMFECADRLMGIYKTHDQSKSVTISPQMFLPLGAAENRLNAPTQALKENAAVAEAA
jgi:structural maintenance of chromosome 4